MNNQPQLIRLGDGQVFELGPATTIGRREDCTLVLDESGISRFHAQINFAGNSLTIEDFSRNGTQVNNAPINGVSPLQHEDIIRFDQDEYKIDYPDAAPVEVRSAPNEPAMTQIAMTEIAMDAKRKPLPDRPADEGTKVVFATANDNYDSLDHSRFTAPSLVIRNGQSAGQVHSLEDSENRWRLGSSNDNDITITDEGVSSQHAIIQRSGNSWEVIDQMSTNVLRVNGSVTNKCYLAKGDKINLGPIDCEFVLPDGYRVRDKPAGGERKSGKRGLWGGIALALIIAVALAAYFFLQTKAS